MSVAAVFLWLKSRQGNCDRSLWLLFFFFFTTFLSGKVQPQGQTIIWELTALAVSFFATFALCCTLIVVFILRSGLPSLNGTLTQ